MCNKFSTYPSNIWELTVKIFSNLALIVELHGYLKKGYGQSCRTFLRELVPDEDSEFICHSKIFVLLSGEEKGKIQLQWGSLWWLRIVVIECSKKSCGNYCVNF